MERALRKAGSRVTKQRRAILDYLASTDSHPSARRVFEETKKNFPRMSLATVYNTIQTLANIGLIKVMDFQTRDNRHETNLSPHINLICVECGKIEDFEEEAAIHAEKVEQQCGFEVRDFRLEYYGTCAVCRVQNMKPANS
jgi:Fur family peroxide stress response transcriptional regulator